MKHQCIKHILNLLATHLQHMYLFQHSYNFSIRTHNHSFLIASRKKPCQKHILLLTFKTLKTNLIFFPISKFIKIFQSNVSFLKMNFHNIICRQLSNISLHIFSIRIIWFNSMKNRIHLSYISYTYPRLG